MCLPAVGTGGFMLLLHNVVMMGPPAINAPVSVKRILASGWDSYVERHPEVRDVERREVEKALDCYGHERGGYVYYCPACDRYLFMSLGCNSRLCSCCGKRYTDQWAKSLSKAMFDVPHRHMVISIPSALWPSLKADRSLWKVYMDSAIDTFDDYFPKLLREPGARVGIIVVFHPFAKSLGFHPHLHLIITEGAFDRRGTFVPRAFIPARRFARSWQYHVLTNLKRAGVPAPLISRMFDEYNGFYVWVHKQGRIDHPKLVAKYLGRYVRHPAIANSRIDWFDGKSVGFHYVDHEEVKHEVVLPVDDFISALIQHIPEPHFKMIRYYGAYARRTKKVFKAYLQSSVMQMSLYRFGFRKEMRCPFCWGEPEFVMYVKKPPPDEPRSQRELLD